MPRRTPSPTLPYLVLICLPLLGLFLRPEDPRPALGAEAAQVVKTYAANLQMALKTAQDSGGPVAAIEACNTQAGPIAALATETSGWTVKRTGLKLRNPASAPDAFERETMALFQARIERGDALADLTRTEIVTDADGRRTVRFAKAIAMTENCTVCHGTELKPEIAARLRALYPEDRAVGFKPGDLRGLFSLSRPL